MGKLIINSRYGIIPNILSNNPKISLKAKGLFGYLQSKPEDWNFSARGISSETKDGIDGVNSGLQELEKFGFLERVKFQDKKGFWDIDYYLFENPDREKPKLENPTLEKPVQENPQTLKEINNKEIIKKK